VSVALAIILGTVIVATAVGVVAGRRHTLSLENWTVGGRRLGLVLVWLLMAGEIYTTFTFLGASGWAYGRGAPAYYIAIYGTLAYTVSFFVLPALWRVGKRHGMHTQPDFFITRYDSPALGVLVAALGVASIVPYLQLQLQGLGLIVEVASGGALGSYAAIVIGFVLTCAFVYTSGLIGVAWVAVIKDVLMIAAVLIVGIAIPYHYFGSFAAVFHAVAERIPGHLVLPGSTAHMGVGWVMSTVLLSALGFYMWPASFPSSFSAAHARVLKRNAIIMPLYQLPILLVLMVGFTAAVVIPGLRNPDMALLAIVQQTFPPWFLGFVGAAGAVTAMVPAGVLVLTAAAILAKNVWRPLLRAAADDDAVVRVSRLFVPILMGATLVLALLVPTELVRLLILGYDGVSQLFPGVVLGLFWPRASRSGVVVGLLAGVGTAAALLLSGHDPLFGLNAGFLALVVNAAVTVAVSLLSQPRKGGTQ
jgi:solute:Na+ symporter, SSS family